ncbi:unnamed protein product [Rangifer tarandus platyrhynchus]|uniref:Uncharacterized protein n=1 Tax=Rangifer tarandus platyrhynchus TaxID=3082113 RepID=A0AC59YB78_RANTA
MPPSTTALTRVWRRCHLLFCSSPELSVCFRPLCFGAETSGLVDSGLPLLARGDAPNPREQRRFALPGGGGGGLSSLSDFRSP